MNFRDWISYRLGSSLLSARPFALSSGADAAATEGGADGTFFPSPCLPDDDSLAWTRIVCFLIT
jgi:hypothetical protein